MPLIVRWPGKIKPGSKNNTPVISHDWFPTLCEVAGIRVSDPPVIDGVSIWPVLTNNETLKREDLFWHFPHYREKDIVPYSIIRSGNWKLIKRYEGNAFELYNLAKDPYEKKDISQENSEKVKQLHRKLTQWLDNVGARLPKENPRYN